MNIAFGSFFQSHPVTGDKEFSKMMHCKQENVHHLINGEYTSVFSHTIYVIKALPEDSGEVLIYAALLHDIGKPCVKTMEEGRARFLGHAQKSREMSERILVERSNLTSQEIKEVLDLIETHDRVGGRKAIGRYFRRYGEEMTRRHLLLRYADIMGQTSDPTLRGPKLEELWAAWDIYQELAEAEI